MVLPRFEIVRISGHSLMRCRCKVRAAMWLSGYIVEITKSYTNNLERQGFASGVSSLGRRVEHEDTIINV